MNESMGTRIRLFVALDIPAEAVEKAMEFQRILKMKGIQARWIPCGNIHLTLKFLGETEQGKTDLIKDIIRESAEAFSPFRLSLRGAGAFPSPSKPNVAWTGLGGETELVMKLARIIDRLLYERLGIERETKGFKPHLTVARFKARVNPEKLSKAIEEMSSRPDFSFVSDCVTLYQSILTREGAQYTVLARYRLKIKNDSFDY